MISQCRAMAHKAGQYRLRHAAGRDAMEVLRRAGPGNARLAQPLQQGGWSGLQRITWCCLQSGITRAHASVGLPERGTCAMNDGRVSSCPRLLRAGRRASAHFGGATQLAPTLNLAHKTTRIHFLNNAARDTNMYWDVWHRAPFVRWENEILKHKGLLHVPRSGLHCAEPQNTDSK